MLFAFLIPSMDATFPTHLTLMLMDHDNSYLHQYESHITRKKCVPPTQYVMSTSFKESVKF
jgi:hypothetical protein